MEKRIQEILVNNPTDHTPIDDIVDLLTELVNEYQARAWDKGFDRGSRAYSGVKRLYVAPGPTKANRNPYRHKLADE